MTQPKATQPSANQPSKLAQVLNTFRNTVYTGLPGPAICPMRYIINIFKGLTFIWVMFLMYWYENYSSGMYLYLFLHGTYGIFWLLKDIFYPDASFKQVASFTSALILVIVLSMYWVIPVTIASGSGIQEPSKTRTYLCIILYISGVILMMGSDYQKTATLAKKKGLISTGFFSRTRNPNYLGEIMIYGSFAICSGHLISYVIVMSMWCSLFAINMYVKDEFSYKSKSGWGEYKNRSYMLLPKLMETDMLNMVLYGGMITIMAYLYMREIDGVMKNEV